VATVVVVLDRESHAVRDDGPVLLATAAHDLTRAVKKIDVSGMGFERRACLPAHAISRPGPGRYVALMGRIDDHLAQEHLTVAAFVIGIHTNHLGATHDHAGGPPVIKDL